MDFSKFSKNRRNRPTGSQKVACIIKKIALNLFKSQDYYLFFYTRAAALYDIWAKKGTPRVAICDFRIQKIVFPLPRDMISVSF